VGLRCQSARCDCKVVLQDLTNRSLATGAPHFWIDPKQAVGEYITMEDTSSELDFRERAKTNDVAVARLIGFEVKEIGDARAVIALNAGPQHANPMGTLHGGILCDIADAAMGLAFASTLAAGESFTTLELKINFFRPVWNAHLTAEGNVVRRGSTVGYVECTIRDEKGELVAKAGSTCLVLRGERAKGR
jgi:uncharacterized protein (TIGR00369 family)